MRKHVSFIFMLSLLVCILSAQIVQATEQRAVGEKPILSFTGTTAICSARCRGNTMTDTIEATLTLYQGNTYIDSWCASGSGIVVFSEECPVEYGKTYRLELVCSINGDEQPSVSVTNTCR